MMFKIREAFLGLLLAAMPALAAPDYAIVVSTNTMADAGWARVVAALQEKHAGAPVLTFGTNVNDTLGSLQARFPRFTCFVATPEEATKEFVASVHRLTRRYDGDPFTDTRWGILTGYDAANALRIAKHRTPLTVSRVLSGTPFAIERVAEGTWYSELSAGEIVRKESGKKIVRTNGPADSTSALVAGLNDYAADLFITSGHATEHDWQIGYRYKNGSFRCENGQIYGLDLDEKKHPVASQHPRVYLPVGNCLMGHISGQDCMALAFMNSAGVMQMAGYTEPTWYGYAGWGMLDYFLEQPGRFTLAEAFVANQNALMHRLRYGRGGDHPVSAASSGDRSVPATNSQDVKGLTFDSEVLAFYGDPGWDARMAEGPLNWEQLLGRDGDTYTFAIMPHFGEKTFEPVNSNGSQRGGRPVIQFLPHRLGPAKILEGAELNPVIADDFILVPLPGAPGPDRVAYKVVFQAAEI